MALLGFRPGVLSVRAQTNSALGWPNRPIRFVVPLAPGGGLDFIARLVGEYIGRSLGQQVVIENKTGGGGTIGKARYLREFNEKLPPLAIIRLD